MSVQDNLLDVGDKAGISPAFLGWGAALMVGSLVLARLLLRKRTRTPDPHRLQ